MIHFTELDRLPTFDVKGNFIGLMADLLVDPERESLRVESYLIKSPAGPILHVAHTQMQSISMRSAQTSVLAGEIEHAPTQPALLHVRKDVLDQQIIDINRRKVVRVTDVEFDIEPRVQHSHLRILAVNVGLAAALRRLLQAILEKHRIRAIADIFPDRARERRARAAPVRARHGRRTDDQILRCGRGDWHRGRRPPCVAAVRGRTGVITLWRKYDLVVLPITDDNHQLLGVITVDDVLELVAPHA